MFLALSWKELQESPKFVQGINNASVIDKKFDKDIQVH